MVNYPKRKSILTRESKVEYWDQVINHYAGCGHGCVYCFAFKQLARRFSHLWWGEEFRVRTYQDWINAKPIENAVELAEEEIPRIKPRLKRILLSATTDPYQPLEREFRLTRRILEILIEYDVPFTILTKSDLVLRDLDLFQKSDCRVGLSITCEPSYMEKPRWELYSSPIQRRIDAIKTLHHWGIPTEVSVEPILPGSNPIEIMNLLRDEVDWWVFEHLNYHKIDKAWYVEMREKIVDCAESLGLNYHIKDQYRKLEAS